MGFQERCPGWLRRLASSNNGGGVMCSLDEFSLHMVKTFIEMHSCDFASLQSKFIEMYYQNVDINSSAALCE